MKERAPLLIVGGPTGVGKTRLSVMLAHRLNGEIISADSMQVYRGMDIGTAKVTEEEKDGIIHHLIDILDPREEFNVTVFQRLARTAIEEIRERGRLPIIAGGTGFYIQALLYGVCFTENGADEKLKKELEKEAEKYGALSLHSRLCAADPASGAAIHPNNVKKVIRALEYYMLTGEKISEHNEREKKRESTYDYAYYVLSAPRPVLYKAIDARVDVMIEAGLEKEARQFYDMGIDRESTSMQGIGYREMYSYFAKEISFDECVRLIKRNTRHFAKRQLTWFKREDKIRWLMRDGSSEDELERLAQTVTEEWRRDHGSISNI